MRYYFKALRNYFNCDGRATRKELWLFFLFHVLIIMVLSFLDGFFGFYSPDMRFNYGYMTMTYIFLTFSPSVCVQIRRLHDVNKSGSWWMLLYVPIVCFYVLYLFLKHGDLGGNQYGMPPIQHRKQGESAVQARKASREEPPEDCRMMNHEAPADSPPQIKYCRKCGHQLIEGSEFCSRCGTKIVKE